jgi:PadR family transcriptional regulator PadR
MGKSYLGTFELFVLLALVHAKEQAYGVVIWREIEARTGHQISPGAVYVTLQRLEEKGLVASKLGDSSPIRGGRAKRYFWILAEGRQALQESEEALQAMWRPGTLLPGGA